jgi:hypothetical protein
MVSPGMNAKKREQPRSSAEDRAGNSQHPSAYRYHAADIAAQGREFEGVVGVSARVLTSQSIGPALPSVQNPSDLDLIAAQPVRNEIRCPADDEFIGPIDAARPAEFWKLQQGGDPGQD